MIIPDDKEANLLRTVNYGNGYDNCSTVSELWHILKIVYFSFFCNFYVTVDFGEVKTAPTEFKEKCFR